jgi:precorrin-2 dehydrogenase
LSGIPVSIDARRARVLVVGGGPAAAGQATAAGVAGATVRVVDPAPCAALGTLAERVPSVTIASRGHAPEDVAWATMVFAVSTDAALNARVAELAQAAGRLVSVAGDGAASTFTSPVALRAGALTIAVAADGLDPVARRVCDMLEERMGPLYGAAMDGLVALRTRLLARGDDDRWADAVESLIDDDLCRSIERGLFARRLAAWQ